ncbi:hypothetical protein OPV22_012736 [Ensete ventricosum]|uniref:Uncharacterized protein n=1 Tax=Ensete ventricosum TaxID=4639 RepID=A0AAV8R3U1_ENSVE|nr:hypothetical protein OPV22_012736 [Ensete ventricosum]
MRPVAELLRSVAAFAGPRYRVAQHVEVSSLPPSPSINAIGGSPVHPSRPLTPRLRHAPRSKLLTWVGGRLDHGQIGRLGFDLKRRRLDGL